MKYEINIVNCWGHSDFDAIIYCEDVKAAKRAARLLSKMYTGYSHTTNLRDVNRDFVAKFVNGKEDKSSSLPIAV